MKYPLTGIKQVDWSLYEKRPTWSHVNSRELSKVFGVHLQSISNWRCRDLLPEPETASKFKGNKNYYRISKIRAWIESKTEEEVHWEWIEKHLSKHELKTVGEAMYLVKACYKMIGVEKP